ncbi:MAG: hypothetical protein JWL90_3879 [Chthoniobacteraceae bacterium]|nr:hypothetical protein [Chthoniobacteraceae bacterium]
MKIRCCKRLGGKAAFLAVVIGTLCFLESGKGDVAIEAPARATRSFAPRKQVNYREPARHYIERKLDKWTFQLERELIEQRPDEADQVVKRLEAKLEQTLQLFPANARERLRTLSIFVMLGSQSANGGQDNGAEYFRRIDPDFRAHLDPSWRNVLVIYSASNYLWQDEHWAMQLLVHELSHAWHLQQWPEKQTDIFSAWQQAMAAGLYHGVKDVNGVPLDKSYAAFNQLEYFAELSCAYFWRGEYEPFDREALRLYDPAGFAMIEKMWGVRMPPPPPSASAGLNE